MTNGFLDGLKEYLNVTETENGAVALKSTLSKCVDAFGLLGSMKDSSESQIVKVFSAAFNEDSKTAIKMLFYIRDIRSGQGARRVFRICLKWLAEHHPEYVIQNFDNIALFGRYDDLLVLFDTSLFSHVSLFIRNKLHEDMDEFLALRPCSLLAKWLPSINASSKETRRYAKMLCKSWHMSEKGYRKLLSLLRKHIDVVERKMSSNNWEDIDFSKVPGKASLNYASAFIRHDEHRYKDYLNTLSLDGNVNSKALYPVDIVKNAVRNRKDPDKQILYNAMWESLPNYFPANTKGMCVVDTSGSMIGDPLCVAVSLGMYCADKCTGPFKNHFITFSDTPSLCELSGNTLLEKLSWFKEINCRSTNIERVFDLILNTAIKNKLNQEDLPDILYIISDMQFNSAINRDDTVMRIIKRRFVEAGYTVPKIVYWNVRSSNKGMFQETFGDEDVMIVSGYSPVIFKSVLECVKLNTTYDMSINPYVLMETTLNNPRYDCIWVG